MARKSTVTHSRVSFNKGNVGTIDRRHFLKMGAAMGLTALVPGSLFAQTRELVVTVYPGSWETAQRTVMLPHVESATGSRVIMTPLLGVDQVAAITAARRNPPYDVVTFDEGPFLASSQFDIVQRFPIEQSSHFHQLLPEFQNEYGPIISGQPVGIAYNTEVFDTPPTSWDAMWDHSLAGRVGLTGAQSSLGTAFLIEIAKMDGGSTSDIEPAFARLSDLLPRVGALAPSPGGLATLFQQGEVVIAPNYFNNVQALQAAGVPIGFAIPETGSPFIRTSLHIVKNTRVPELAFQFIEAAMDPEVQVRLMASPHNFIPSNQEVPISGDIKEQLFADWDEFQQRFTFYDWNDINPNRSAWIERFNREVRV